MAEPFGIVSGAVGIAVAFTACVDCFNYVQLGRRFGRDFQTALITLRFSQLRLTRWGDAVDIYSATPRFNPADGPLIKDALMQILVLFAASKNVADAYKLRPRTKGKGLLAGLKALRVNESKSAAALGSAGSALSGATVEEVKLQEGTEDGGDLPPFVRAEMDPLHMGLSNAMERLARRRQKGASVLQTAAWALHGREELERLLDGLAALLEGLEAAVPLPDEKRAEMVTAEVAAVQREVAATVPVGADGGAAAVRGQAQQINSAQEEPRPDEGEEVHGAASLRVLAAAAQGARDAWAQKVVGDALAHGVFLENVVVDEDATAILGDHVVAGYTGQFMPAAPRAIVGAKVLGRAKVVMGSQYGGAKGIFD